MSIHKRKRVTVYDVSNGDKFLFLHKCPIQSLIDAAIMKDGLSEFIYHPSTREKYTNYTQWIDEYLRIGDLFVNVYWEKDEPDLSNCRPIEDA